MRARLTVVKLGGSHAASPHLRAWLTAIARGAGRMVVVPGGGPFADAVRAAQPVMNYDDKAAHHMALLAMEQYGHALTALDPSFEPADSIGAIRRAARAGRVPVWLPSRMVLAATDIPASWDVTSDSLSAWLARRIKAKRLVLIKQVDPPPAPARIADLQAAGVVDRSLSAFLDGSDLDVMILGPTDLGDGQSASVESMASRSLPLQGGGSGWESLSCSESAADPLPDPPPCRGRERRGYRSCITRVV